MIAPVPVHCFSITFGKIVQTLTDPSIFPASFES